MFLSNFLKQIKYKGVAIDLAYAFTLRDLNTRQMTGMQFYGGEFNAREKA